MMIDQAARHLIATALEEVSEGSGLWVGPAPTDADQGALPGALTWCRESPATLLAAPWRQRHDIAIAWLSADLPQADALHLLSSLRDLHARRLLAFLPVAAWQVRADGWQPDTLRALALQQQARITQDEQELEVWSYDIRTYKAVPDWLNPKFWANPENWNKYRW